MKTIITIPVWLHDFKKEDLIAEAERREKLALARNLLLKNLTEQL